MQYCELHVKGGYYLEFQKGDYEQERWHHHWLDSSIYMDGDVFQELSLYFLFSQVISNFDTFGVTKVSQTEWEQIKALALTFGTRVCEALQEIDQWAEGCFLTEECFTVLGI